LSPEEQHFVQAVSEIGQEMRGHPVQSRLNNSNVRASFQFSSPVPSRRLDNSD